MTRARDTANLIGSGNFSSTTFTATAGQTAFTISHTQGFVQVFMNGLLLDETVDYTSNGTAITLTSGAAAGDEIEVVKYDTFSVGDAITQAAADTRYVNTTGDTMSGNLTVDTNTFHVDATNDRVGIGTTAPTNNLTIVDGGATPYAADTQILLDLKRNTTNSGASNAVAIRLANNSNGFTIKYGGASDTLSLIGGSGNAMATFTNDGALTLPYQPAFYMRNTNDSTRYKGGTVYVNRSNSWNNTTGTFTAPVAGAYQFGAFGQSNAGVFYILAYKNGSAISAWYDSGSGGYKHASLTIIMDMAVNDTMYIGNANINTGGQNGMFGHFLG